ncbi:MAG: hypothetical protein B0D92_04115 [Spirochaeta sp. LUC14_002_19_P3]|nr:MAG: hypothetical protein B0D92_04115 [Spirochaeta sp. LUC14_002_19_P3]
MKINSLKLKKLLAVSALISITALSLVFLGCPPSSTDGGHTPEDTASSSPENFTPALTTTAGEVKLTWDAPTDRGYFAGAAATAISYKVYSSSSDISDVTGLTPVYTGADLSFTFSGTAGESYYFAITANNGGADSPLSKTGQFELVLQLHLDPNGGSGGVATTNYDSVVTTAIPAPTGITKTGSTLAAWNTAADSSGTYYNLQGAITLTADLTLYAVWSTNDLAYTLINADAQYSVTGGTVPDTATYIEVPGYWQGKKVTQVGNDAFKNYYDLMDIKLPSTITSIGNNAFDSCHKLALSSLPNGITSIGQRAFSGCTELVLTSLPDGITSISERAFSSTSKLALTSLPDGITSIGKSAFYGCSKLALSSLPDGITSIGEYAFQRCYEIALSNLPDGITSIGKWAFAECSKLTLTSLPSGLKRLEERVFYYSQEINFASLPNGLEYIGGWAFDTTKSSFTTLPGTVKTLANQALSDTVMTSMTIPASVTSIGTSLFFDNEVITEVTLEGEYGTLNNIFGTGDTGKLATVNITNDTSPATLNGDVFPSTVTSIKVPASAVTDYQNAWGTTLGAGVTISAYSP